MKFTLRIWILIIALLFAFLMITTPGLLFSKGAMIKSVESNSTEFNSGIRAGMIITQLNSVKITNAGDYLQAASLITAQSKVVMTTNEGEFIYLADGIPQITVSDIQKTKIKTGLDLSGGARALVRPENASLNSEQINELVQITSQRLNAFGLSDMNIRAVSDLQGNKFMLVEVAGATPEDLRELVGKQGKFEAKIANQSVFEGGERDIADVCRSDAKCAGIESCQQSQQGTYYCNFRFAVYLTQKAAEKHAAATANLSLDETGQYLKEKLYLYLDDKEVDSLNVAADLRGRATTDISIQGSGTGASQEDAYNDAKANMNKLQTLLLTGSLPYKLEVVKLDSISASLGKEFTKGLIYLGLFVFAAVSIAIFAKYRKIKLTLAVILTMFSEALLTLAIAAFIKWNLDAPGIAGIIAGIGTGVNDQIVMLDESSSGESSSIKERIKRAFFIIVGAFFTIVAAMIPLFWAGAGMLKGFALTTIIGVSAGILITRPAFADIIKQIQE